MKYFEQLLEVVRRKAKYDQSNSWYLGPHTYLNELKKEVDEVFDEIPRERTCYLEDELAGCALGLPECDRSARKRIGDPLRFNIAPSLYQI